MINIENTFKDLLVLDPLFKNLTLEQKKTLIKAAKGLDEELSRAFDQILGKY
jgi:hypothetical protein